jgi:hypothetical protein
MGADNKDQRKSAFENPFYQRAIKKGTRMTRIQTTQMGTDNKNQRKSAVGDPFNQRTIKILERG